MPPPLDENAEEPVVELGTLQIPKLGVVATLYEGIRLPTFDRGPGHWPGTAMPGEFGNAVIGGHRTSKSKPFRYLDELVPGDEVVFTTSAGSFVYRVTSSEIVDPLETRLVNQNPGFTATLFACHPVGSTKERIVVHLTLVVR
jgi:sortase A